MVTREKLEKETDVFFDRHWGKTAMPAWDFSWNWCGSVPNHNLCGVYALFSSGKLIYIDSGSSHGHGVHKKHGIGKRLLAHVLEIAPVDSDVSYIPEARWQSTAVDLVATIGFPQEFSYLASALEYYLIEKLDPPGNHTAHHSKSCNDSRRLVA